MSPDRVNITWNFVACNKMVDRNEPVKLAIKDGSNRWWFAFQASNSVNHIKDIQLLQNNQWIQMEKMKYGFWQGSNSQGLTFPVTVEATDAAGKKYSKSLSSLEGDQLLNF